MAVRARNGAADLAERMALAPIAGTFSSDMRLLAAALVLSVIGELGPIGGVVAGAALHRSPSVGAVLPLCAGALSIGGTLAVLFGTSEARPHERR